MDLRRAQSLHLVRCDRSAWLGGSRKTPKARWSPRSRAQGPSNVGPVRARPSTEGSSMVHGEGATVIWANQTYTSVASTRSWWIELPLGFPRVCSIFLRPGSMP
jgi:hypothetical protein